MAENNLIKALHAVGVGEWLKEDVEFEYNECHYKISKHGHIDEYDGDYSLGTPLCEELCDMIKNPNDIKPYVEWSKETIKDAEAAQQLGYSFAARRTGDIVTLYAVQPDSYPEHRLGEKPSVHFKRTSLVEARVGMNKFREVKDGECVKLMDITGE